MLIATIIIPDGEHDPVDLTQQLVKFARELGGEVLQAHAVDEQDGDLDAVDCCPTLWVE